MREPKITRDDILAAIAKATRRVPGGEGFRVTELVEMTGLTQKVVETAIATGLKAGTIRRTTKVVERIDGALRRVPSYVFLKGKACNIS